MIVDGADNFPTRYLLNDASVWHRIPVVHGSIFRFEGQVTVFKPGRRAPATAACSRSRRRPSWRRAAPRAACSASCRASIGSIQANEALKLALGIGDPLVGRLLLFDALAASFTEVSLRRDPACPVCGDDPTITEYIDYVEFCQRPTRQEGARMTTVRIPPTLRTATGGEREVPGLGRHGRRAARRPDRRASRRSRASSSS